MKNISMRKIAAYNNDSFQYPIVINNDTDTDLTLVITPTQGIGDFVDRAAQTIGIGRRQTITLKARSSYTFNYRIKSIFVGDNYGSSYHDTNQLAELVSYDEAKGKYSVNITQLFTPSSQEANTNARWPIKIYHDDNYIIGCWNSDADKTISYWPPRQTSPIIHKLRIDKLYIDPGPELEKRDKNAKRAEITKEQLQEIAQFNSNDSSYSVNIHDILDRFGQEIQDDTETDSNNKAPSTSGGSNRSENQDTTNQSGGQAGTAPPTSESAAPIAPAPAPAPVPAAPAADTSKAIDGLKKILKLTESNSLRIDTKGFDFRSESKVWRGVIKGYGDIDKAATACLNGANFDDTDKTQLSEVAKLQDSQVSSAITMKSYLKKINDFFYKIKNMYSKRFLGITVATEEQIAKAVAKGLTGTNGKVRTSSLSQLNLLSKVAARRERAKKSLDSAIEKEASVEDDMTSKVEKRRAAARAKLGL